MALTAWVYGKPDGFLSLHVATDSADTLNEFADAFQEELGLSVAPDPMTRLSARMSGDKASGGRIFIGHGTSALWLSLKAFLVNDLGLDYDEFNREPAAGYSTKERLEQMLRDANFAFLIMTAEDEHADGNYHARENVIHEVGLVQGCHGFERAIVLLEDGCAEFSNIRGLTQIRFPKGNILAKSEDIRRVLQREGVLEDSR
jgi:predicted nucleotide-binding protein